MGWCYIDNTLDTSHPVWKDLVAVDPSRQKLADTPYPLMAKMEKLVGKTLASSANTFDPTTSQPHQHAQTSQAPQDQPVIVPATPGAEEESAEQEQCGSPDWENFRVFADDDDEDTVSVVP